MRALRKQLLKIQRASYRKNLKRIEETLTPDASVDRYSGEYHRYLRRYRAISSKAELLKRILTSDIVFHGDYHTLNQSQRAALRILREIVGKRDIILCLEMFHAEDQRFLDQYMQKDITRRELLKKIKYRKKWGYNWENWKPVIDLCRKNGIPIIGINSEHPNRRNSLKLRDVFSSKIIGKLVIQHPDTLIYVVDGDYHISPNHLPYQVEKRLKEFDVAVKRTIIYQNAANLYWQLADQNREETNVLLISPDSFCIMNTTPANKLQSYINWLEYSIDAYYPVQSDWEEVPEETDSTSIPSIVKTICSVLELPYPEDAVERLEIFYGSNLDFMGIVSRSSQLAPMLPSIRQKIKNEEAFLLEYEKNRENAYLIYLPNSSLNMAAEEAAHFLNAALRGRQKGRIKPFDAFYVTVITEALGFFGSKLINEKRKVQTRNRMGQYIGSFKKKAPSKEERRKIHLCRLLLKHRYLENVSHHPADYKAKFKEIFRARTRLHREFATRLGYMLGDKLYYGVKKRKFSLREIIDLFSKSFTAPNEAFVTYCSLSARVARKKIRQPQDE